MSIARPWFRASEARRPRRHRAGRRCPPPPSSAACSHRRRRRRDARACRCACRRRPTAPSASQASSRTPRPCLACELQELREGGGVAEDVDRQKPGRPLPHHVGRGVGIEVKRHRVDVAEDRSHVLVEQAVGRRDERERRRHDLVALAPAERSHAQVKRQRCLTRPRRHRRPQAKRRTRARSAPARGPSESRPERRTSSTSSSSRSPISGLASGISSRFVKGLTLCCGSWPTGATRSSTRSEAS